MELHKKIIEQYADSRRGTFKKVVCHAPFVNLNFEQNGNVRACCYNTKDVLGNWTQNSIHEIWSGGAANKLRKHIIESNLGGGCKECGNMIVAGNHQGVRAKYYDEFSPNNLISRAKYMAYQSFDYISYPRVMEFELSNECNLECVMCNGYFSSSIRKNREKLPPFVSPYNDKFVDELEEFIPHLTDAKFLGGEPFMIEIYLKIWERILKINPSVRIHITTNGTFLNNRIKNLLEGLKAGIILSIDSVNEETYKKIRINGNFKKVMENLEYLLDYTKRKRTFISMAVCPITLNWRELPQMLEFCLDRGIALYFNAVFSPAKYSLKEQGKEYISEVISFLESYCLPKQKGNLNSPTNLSISAYKDFVKLLKGWEKEISNTSKHEVNTSIHATPPFSRKEAIEWSMEQLIQKVNELGELTKQGYIDKEVQFLNEITNLFIAIPETELAAVFKYYILMTGAEMTGAEMKAKEIAELVNTNNSRKTILAQMAKASPMILAENLASLNIEEMKLMINTHFS